ncbi:MAG: anti-sigma factor family protein [Pirellulales bacterium]
MPDESPLPADQREQLVAYLDGELAEEEARRVERQLAGSEAARREVQFLARTWDLLDLLPRRQPPGELTEQTLSQIRAESLHPGDWRGRVGRWARRGGFVAAWAGSLAAAAALGFAAVRAFRPSPSEQLLNDLPVIENLTEYQEIGSYEFLRALYEADFPLEEMPPESADDQDV